MKNKIFKLILILVLGVILINSCEKEKFYPPSTTKEFHSIMNEWYFWKDSISYVDHNNFSSPFDLLEAMRFTDKDKWSYITTKEEHSQYYEEGTYVGYGFSFNLDEDNNVRITFLFEDCEFKEFGIERGWIIRKINGNSVDGNLYLNSFLGDDVIGVSNEFEFESPSGETLIQSFNKKLIVMNTVGYVDVFEVGTYKVGYFVFKSFIGPSINELNETFSYFSNEGVNELVIDLRYNGGGQISVVEHLAGLIIPDNVNGKICAKYIHNSDKSNQDENIYFVQNANSLRLNKVYFITAKGSASASEVIINSLEPYIDVFLVGDDTYGKPVGMYSFESRISDLVYVPISFALVNASNYGGYYEGLPADSYVSDDILSNFGLGEDVFDEVIYHIEHGSFSSGKSSIEIYSRPYREIRNLRDEIGAL